MNRVYWSNKLDNRVALFLFYENGRRDVRLKRLGIISGRNRFPTPLRSSDIRKNPAYDGNVCDCRYRFRSRWFSAISEIAHAPVVGEDVRTSVPFSFFSLSLSFSSFFLFIPRVCLNWISTVLFHAILCNSQWPLFRSFMSASFPLPVFAFIVSAGRSRGSPAFSCFWSDNAYTSAHVPSMIKRGGRKWWRRRGTRREAREDGSDEASGNDPMWNELCRQTVPYQ